MERNCNVVIDGAYTGCKVETSSGLAFVRTEGAKGVPYQFITKNQVKEVRAIGSGVRQSTMEETAINTAIFGAAGTANSLRGTPVRLLEITWNSGLHSLIRVDEQIAEAITVGMYRSVSLSEEGENRRRVESNETSGKIVLWAVVIIGAVLALAYTLGAL